MKQRFQRNMIRKNLALIVWSIVALTWSIPPGMAFLPLSDTSLQTTADRSRAVPASFGSAAERAMPISLPNRANERPEQSSAMRFFDRLPEGDLLSGLEFFSVDRISGRFRSAAGRLSPPLRSDLKPAVQAFVREHADLFNLPIDGPDDLLTLVRDERVAGGHHFAWQMMLDGIPVRDARIDIHLDDANRVMLAHGSLPHLPRLANTIRLSRASAIERAIKAVGATDLYEKPRVHLEIIAAPQHQDAGAVAYVVAVPARAPLGCFLVTLDAETGEEISRTNEMWSSMEGVGSVYRHHPLAGPITHEPLRYLASSTLTGLYVAVRNRKGPLGFSAQNRHIYDPASPHFDEVMVYYHLNLARDRFAAMGFNRLDYPIPAIVHYGDNLDNAVYDSIFGVLGFGSGSRYHSFAREESIIYHEYSHAVMVSIVKIRNAGESGAMNEGQADYFGSSFSDDPIHGEYVASKAGIPYIRTLLHSLKYPQDIVGTVHKDGRIWAGALWDVRTALGAEVTDRLLHASHFYLKPGDPTFIDGVQALFAADKALYAGRYRQAISSVMSRRGIHARSYPHAVLAGEDLRAARMFRRLHQFLGPD
jgi:hypothetical protein